MNAPDMLTITSRDGIGALTTLQVGDRALTTVEKAVVTISANDMVRAELTMLKVDGEIEVLPENVTVNIVQPLIGTARHAADSLADLVELVAGAYDSASPEARASGVRHLAKAAAAYRTATQ